MALTKASKVINPITTLGVTRLLVYYVSLAFDAVPVLLFACRGIITAPCGGEVDVMLVYNRYLVSPSLRDAKRKRVKSGKDARLRGCSSRLKSLLH